MLGKHVTIDKGMTTICNEEIFLILFIEIDLSSANNTIIGVI